MSKDAAMQAYVDLITSQNPNWEQDPALANYQ